MPGRLRPGLRAKQGIEIDGKNVGLDDLDVGKHPEAQAKLRGEHAVELDGDQAPRALGEKGSEDTASRADFEHRIL